jgi:hypothetical protein
MLQKIGFLPGFNKQVTPTGGEFQWQGGSNVRFRYGTPEKIGGWEQLGDDTLVGAARAQHHLINNDGTKYSVVGTNRILYVYSGGVFYDIHPIKSTTTETNAFTTTNGSTEVTVTTSTNLGLEPGDILLFDNFTTITNSNYVAADFDDKKFMVTTVPTSTTFTITMTAAEGGSGATTSGGIRIQVYYPVGPVQQAAGHGFGTGQWSGTVSIAATSTLSTALADDASDTSVVVADSSQFETSVSVSSPGYVLIGTEEISYTANDTGTNTLSGGARAQRGTTRAAHILGVTVKDTTDYFGWGKASGADFTIDPGLWVIDSFGQTVIAMIYNGRAFEWDASLTAATSTRATAITGTQVPTASRHMIVSTPDRHLVFLGTETTLQDATTQDPMFIRFGTQESLTDYTPTAINTAGTQRLTDGSRIMSAIRGRDAMYIWTDTALYLMRYVGQPFTFSFEQVGTNCGLIGKNAAIEVDGAAYWMSENGFFRYTGKLESMQCLVEDYVYDDINTRPRDLIFCGLNNLFGEIMWFFPTASSEAVNRMVSFNYLDSTSQRPIWVTNDNTDFARTTWADSSVFGKPYGTAYDPDTDVPSTDDTFVVGNTEGSTTYYQHETGTDQVTAAGATTNVLGSIESGDFDITQDKQKGITFRGDGEFLMSIRRFIPDFLAQTGNTQVTLNLKNYPTDSYVSSSLGPFTITTSTTKQDCRARARAVQLKVANTGASQAWKMGTFRLDTQADGRR